MNRGTEWTLDEATHNQIYSAKVLPKSGYYGTTPKEHPHAIVLAGQPGAGKGGLADAAKAEFAGDIVTLDLDEKRQFHRDIEMLREKYPYTWSSHTHPDARGWADKLTHDFVEGRRNIVFDTTLGGADHWIGEIKKMQGLSTHPYEVEVRVLATHQLESEHGVHARFTDGLDKDGYSRFVPEEVRINVYENLPANLDKLHAQLPNVRIRIFNREGQELYDSRTSPLKPGVALEQAREARLTEPARTHALRDKWQNQEAREQKLPASIEHNPKVSPPTAQNVLRENGELKIKPEVAQRVVDIFAIDHAVRVEPALARGALGLKVANAAAVAVDVYSTGREALHLLDQGNVTGAQSQVLHFGARNLGMLGGAAAGASMGAAAGVESGPGLFITGAIGGVVGAVAGDKLMDAADQARIEHQRGSDGNAWHLDERPGHGWMRMSTDEGPGRGGMPMRPVYADARLADELNYKASSVAVELALAHPRAPQDPYSHTPESIGEAVRPGIGANEPWTRDLQGHAWTRQALEPASTMSHGMSVQHVITASPELSRQLDAASQRVIADNIVHSPQGIAQRYQEAYDQHGWKQHGPVPAAVTDAAAGQVREERDATRQQMPAPPQPASGHLTPQQIERITTHESRVVPTPGGMRFAEAHKRRNEPEQISPGSLQPVGKLDTSHLDKGSQLHRMHRVQEQDLMRGLGIAIAQDRDRFKNEPSPQRTQQPSVERTQERAPDQAPRRLLEETPEQKPPEARQAAPLPSPMHSNPQGAAFEQRVAPPPPSQPMAQPASAALAAAQAELAEMRERVARMEAQRRQDGLERRDQRETTQFAPMHDTRQHLDAGEHDRQPANVASHTRGLGTLDRLSAFSDPSHPHNALYSKLKALLPEGTPEKRLAQSTSACYLSGIDEKNLRGIDIGDTRAVFAGNTFMKSGIAVVDISQPPPTVQQSEQQVRQYDQQQTQMMSEIRAQNAAQANQQQGQTLVGP